MIRANQISKKAPAADSTMINMGIEAHRMAAPIAAPRNFPNTSKTLAISIHLALLTSLGGVVFPFAVGVGYGIGGEIMG